MGIFVEIIHIKLVKRLKYYVYIYGVKEKWFYLLESLAQRAIYCFLKLIWKTELSF